MTNELMEGALVNSTLNRYCPPLFVSAGDNDQLNLMNDGWTGGGSAKAALATRMMAMMVFIGF